MLAVGDRPARNGFTLLEMLVVLAITAMASTLVFPQLDRALRILSLRQASFALNADLHRARADAILSGEPQRIIVDPRGTSYHTESRERAAPRGISFAGPSKALLFFSDGSSSGGEIAVKTRGAVAVVRVDPGTGGFEVEDGR